MSDPLDLVETQIAELHAVIALERGATFAARCASFTAHLEQIREIRREPISQSQRKGPVAEVAHHEPLVARAVPDELHATQMNGLAAQRDLAVLEKIGIAEIRREYGVVVLGHRAQEKRPRLFEKQLQLRQHARVAVVEPLRILRLAADIAAVIEHREGVSVLQRAGAPLLQRRAHGDGELRRGCFVDRLAFGQWVRQG